LGNFFLSIALRRTGRLYEVRARVNDSAGAFNCKCRQNDLRGAVRDLVRMLTQRLHTQCLQRAAMA
jgi:hypothetical protein